MKNAVEVVIPFPGYKVHLVCPIGGRADEAICYFDDEDMAVECAIRINKLVAERIATYFKDPLS